VIVPSVKKEKWAHSTSEGTLDVELLHQQHCDGDHDFGGTHSNWKYELELAAHAADLYT
jgi:hypothetical protein